jgi:putative copper export protein
MPVWTLIRFLHLTAAAAWVGLQLALFLFVPLLRRRLGSDDARALVRDIGKRLAAVAAVALPTLAATGAALASHEVPSSQSGLVDIKLLILIAVAALLAGHGLARSPRQRIAASVLMLLLSLTAVAIGAHLAET